MTSRLSLGESRFTGGYRLEFRQKKEQVIAKLYDKEDVKLGSCTLKNLSVQPWTYETLPQLAKSRIEQFLNSHDVPLGLERVTTLHPEGMVTGIKNLSIAPASTSSSSTSTSSTAIFPFPLTTPSATLPLSSSHQLSLEDLGHLLHRLGCSESRIQALTQSSSPEEQRLVLVDTLFEQILSLSHPSLDSSLLDIRDSQGYNLFLATVALGEETQYQAIFPYYRGKKELYAKDPRGRNALHIAASLGHHRLIPPLIEAGLKIDKKDGHGLVPLHWAIHAGNPKAVLALIEQGASLATPWITPRGQYFPLEMSIVAGNPAVLRVLLENDRSGQLDFGQSVHEIGTLLHLAIRSNQAPMFEYLLAAHFDKMSFLLNRRDPQGKTPLQLAAYLGDLYTIRVLHRYKVELNYGKGEKGGTAVHYAAQGEQPNVIRLLDWLDADLQSTNDKGETPYILLKGRKTPAAQECKALLTRLPRMARSEKTEPPNYIRRPPYNLVIQGGGPKGIAYLGALEAMERLGTFSELKRLAGTSAGAITAAFLAVGCKLNRLKELLNRNFEEFLDADNPLRAGLLEAAQRQSYQEAIQALLKDYWEGWSTLLHPIKRAQNLRDKLIKLTGLASGEAVRKWIDEVIQQQTGIQHCTFGELQELSHQNPQKYKELHIFSIRVGTGPQPEVVRFSHEDPAWKDLIISDAVRASLSIPGVFQPHVLHFKDATGIRHPREHHGKFTDAGLIRKFPIDAFDAEKYQEDPHFHGEKTNRRTLGLSLREITPHGEEEILNISSSTDLLKAMMSTYYNAEQILLEETGLYKDRMIVIPIQGIGLFDFDATEEIKQLNINAGREKTDNFFQPAQPKKHVLEYTATKAFPPELPSGTSIPYRYAVFYDFQSISSQEETKATFCTSSISPAEQRALELVTRLRIQYTSHPYIALLIPQDPKEIPIEKLYTRLAIIREAEQKEKKRETEHAYPGQDLFSYGITPTHESIFEPKEAIELEKILNHGPLKTAAKKRVLIQGSAGIGKTTLCHHIAYRWAQKDLFQEFDYLFWLPLRNLNKELYPHPVSLADYLAKECQLDRELIQSFLQDPQWQDKTLLLLDGYDELSSDALNSKGCFYSIFKELKAFPHLLMTTRPQLVDLDPKPVRLEILGFDAKGVEEYIDRFFSKEQGDQAQEMRRLLKQPLIRSLSRIPINLEIFCSLVAVGEPLLENPTMTTLYIQLTDWLFKRFRIERSSTLNNPIDVVEESDPRHAEEVDPLAKALEEIAWEAMKQNKLYLPESQITSIFRKVDRQIHLSDMRKIGPLRIEENKGVFIHLTFQEFFASAYLAHLYESNQKAAKKKLEKIKFEPRYQLVLAMTAGCLSHLSKKKFLQAFFDDLFSKPTDLAISYGLRLQARCFEECQEPEGIAQYKSFIEKVVLYLKHHPNDSLKVNLLIGNNKILSHEKIISFFIHSLQDEAQQKSGLKILEGLSSRGQVISNPTLSFLIATRIIPHEKDVISITNAIQVLKKIAQSGQLPNEGLTALISLLKNPESYFDAKHSAAKALMEVAKSDQPLAKEALIALMSSLKDPESDFDAKCCAALALREVAKSGQPLTKEALTALMNLLKDPEADIDAKRSAADALMEVAKSGQPLAQETLTALMNLLKDPEADFDAKISAADALGEVAKSGQPLAQETLTALMNLLKDPEADVDAKTSAADALMQMAGSVQPLAQEALTALISLVTNPEARFYTQEIAATTLMVVAKSGQPFAQKAQTALMSSLTNPEASFPTQEIAAIALRELAESGQPLPQEALTALMGLLTNPEADSAAKCSAALALREVAEGDDQALAQEALIALMGLLTNPEADFDSKFSAALALIGVAKSNQTLAQEALTALMSLITDPKADVDYKSSAIIALVEVAKKGQPWAQETLTALISLITNPEADDDDKLPVAETLMEVAKSGQPLPWEALTALIRIVTNPESGSDAKRFAATALGEMAMSDQPLAQEALTALIRITTDLTADVDARRFAATALRDIAKSGHLAQKTLAALMSSLINLEADSNSKFFAAIILLGVAQRGLPLPPEALAALISLLTDREGNFFTQEIASDALQEVAKNGHPLPPEEALIALIHIVTDSEVEIPIKIFAATALGEIAKRGHPLPLEALTALMSCNLTDPMFDVFGLLEKIVEGQSYRLSHQSPAYKLLVKLCFLTGQAFFFRDGQFYITKKQGTAQLEVKAGMDPGKLYEEILSDLSNEKILGEGILHNFL